MPSSLVISIHAPLAGRDRPPLPDVRWRPISIHAPLAGRDYKIPSFGLSIGYFNPRAPCGARPVSAQASVRQKAISIHAPLAGRDSGVLIPPTPVLVISIHAPLAGRDHGVFLLIVFLVISIHAPLAGRDALLVQLAEPADISIHAPLAGRDSKFDEFLSANLHKSNKRDLLSEEKMRHSLPQTAHVSHFRSFFGAKLQRFSARLPFALRS